MIFAGSPGFAAHILEVLCQHHLTPRLVLSQPPKPAGRGQQLQHSPVAQLAMDLGIPLLAPKSLKTDPHVLEQLQALKPQLMIVAAYGLILPASVLNIPTLGCINVHASLLPKYRGASPITQALLQGDSITGISLMQMDVGLDTGPVLYQKKCPISADDTTGSLTLKLAKLGAQVLIEQWPAILQQQLKPQPQNPAKASHTFKISKNNARIHWSNPSSLILRHIQAYDPWPVAHAIGHSRAHSDPFLIKIWKAVPGTGEPTKILPGTVLNVSKQGLEIATQDGSIRIVELQLPNEKRMKLQDFLNSPSKAQLFQIGDQWPES